MTTPTPNPGNQSSAVVTRLRKRRDLETTMNTLKQLLEPTLALTNKTGSRKKNKPRSLAKKVVAPKKVKALESCSEGEYYPNKMKRKVRLRKTVLKPRHDLKVVLATTNKRKRGTPHKGLESLYEETPTFKLKNINAEGKIKTKTDNLKVDTELMLQTLRTSNPDKYELISPPHKSLTEMTVDDLIRMDEDSLSDENLLEILTCPSPVWWEDPQECTGSLFITSAEDETNATNVTNNAKHTTTTYINKAKITKTDTVSEIKTKGKKIAKLESILGHIKSLARSENTLDNSNPANHSDIAPNARVDTLDTDSIPKINDINGDETKVEEIDACEVNISKRRTISSSGSEISVNEDDLLRDLESLSIPIQEQELDVNDLKKDAGDDINDENDRDIISASESGTSTCDDVDKESSDVNESGEIHSDKSDVSVKDPERHRKKYSNKSKESNNRLDTNEDITEQKHNVEKDSGSKTKSILERLQKQSDDILDVRLIKTSTNNTNEVQVWSKLDNFKRHNYKPEDFVSEVIDIEDELEFSMIENSPLKGQNTLKSKSEPILIDDDSNDRLEVSTMLKVNDTISIDSIEQCSDVTIATIIDSGEIYQSCEIIEVDHSKVALVPDQDNLKETIIEDDDKNDPDYTVPEISDILQPEDSVKPKRKRKKAAGVKPPLKSVKKKKRPSPGIQILPMEAVAVAPTPPLISCPAEICYQYLNKHTHCSVGTIDRKKNKTSIDKNLDTTDANDTILCLDGVDVSLVKNPVPRKDVKLKMNKEGKIHKNYVKQNDLSITLVETIPMTTNNPTEAVFESPISVNSEACDNTLEYSESTISDMNIQFLDEYEGNKSKGENWGSGELEENGQKTSEEMDIEFRKDLIIVKHIAENSNIVTDMENYGVNCSFGDLDEDDKGNRDDTFNELNMNEQDNLEQIRIENITQNYNQENQMEPLPLQDTCVENNTEETEHLNSHDIEEDLNETTIKEEFVTIYQIVSNSSQIENIDAKEKSDEEG